MKATYKLFAIAASLVMLSSLSQAALLTNEFITAGGNFTNEANWSQGTVPVIGTDVGVLNSITATNTSTRPFDNKQLILNGTALLTAPSAPLTGTNFNIVLNNTGKLYASSGGSMSYGTLVLNDSSMIHFGRDQAFTNCTITLNGTSTGQVNRTTKLLNQSVVNLNDSSVFIANSSANATYIPVVDSTSYFNFNSTGTVLKVTLTSDFSADFNQWIVDGRILANGNTASTNNFNVTYTSGVGTSVQLIPEPATAGLFGLAGAMVFLLRRQMKKKQTDEID